MFYFYFFQKRQSIDLVACRQTSALTWIGLGLMSVQFGILARLTWWEYSWDIMEPVTYFVTYGTAMAVYAYYVLTKQVSYCFKNPLKVKSCVCQLYKSYCRLGLCFRVKFFSVNTN